MVVSRSGVCPTGPTDQELRASLAEPVVLSFDWADRPSRAIYKAVFGRRLREPADHYDVPCAVVSKADACCLLAKHCGGEGRRAAELLTDPILSGGLLAADQWSVELCTEFISTNAHLGLMHVYGITTYFCDPHPWDCPTLSQVAADPGPRGLRLDTVRGYTDVESPTGRDTVEAAALVVALVHGTPVVFGGRRVRVPIVKDDLAALLADRYADRPEAVAAAMRALDQLGARSTLQWVLSQRSELGALNAAVSALLGK